MFSELDAEREGRDVWGEEESEEDDDYLPSDSDKGREEGSSESSDEEESEGSGEESSVESDISEGEISGLVAESEGMRGERREGRGRSRRGNTWWIEPEKPGSLSHLLLSLFSLSLFFFLFSSSPLLLFSLSPLCSPLLSPLSSLSVTMNTHN